MLVKHIYVYQLHQQVQELYVEKEGMWSVFTDLVAREEERSHVSNCCMFRVVVTFAYSSMPLKLHRCHKHSVV
jgi:succinate dehydrogenase hydrophobic anchor subunit